MVDKRILPFTLLVMLLACKSIFAADAHTAYPEFCFLIDRNLSLSKTDPNSQRILAVELMSQILPEQSQAGIWMFGDNAKALMPMENTDKTWKEKARLNIYNVTATHQYRDIAAALGACFVAWENDNTPKERHAILITDGHTMVSNDPEDNKAEAIRILEKTVPILQLKKIRVHTIGFSQNADHEFLQSLSKQTGGYSLAAETTSTIPDKTLELAKLLMSNGENTLEAGKINIDAYSSQVTFLLYHNNRRIEPTLISPSGKRIALDSPFSTNVRWADGKYYDIVTVSHPETGTWTVENGDAARHYAFIHSSFKIFPTPMPKILFARENIPYHAKAVETIGEIPLPEDVQFRMEIIPEGETTMPETIKPYLSDSQTQGKRFTQNLTFDQAGIGKHTLVLHITGEGLQRKHTTPIEIFAPPISYTKKFNDLLALDMSFSYDNQKVKPSTVELEIHQKFIDNEETLIKKHPIFLSINPLKHKPEQALSFRVTGETSSGRIFTLTLPTETLEFPKPKQIMINMKKPDPSEAASDTSPSGKEPTDKTTGLSGLWGALLFFGLLLLLTFCAFAIKLILHRQIIKHAIDMKEKLSC